ncbi:MAG: energy transducer TonB, partial [Acetobacter malorum]
MVRPRRSEQTVLRRCLYLSGGAHIAFLLALLVSLPPPKPEEEPPPVVEMQFEAPEDSGGSPAKASQPSSKPTPPAPVPNDAPPTPEPPKEAPN